MDPVVNVIRAPSLKRGKADERLSDRIKLKKIIGLTVCSSAGLDVSQTTGILAYPAGCTVVLFNSKKLSQSYLLNTSRKAITAVAYSRCGRYLATGECGINPTIKVWELELSPGNESNVGGTVIAEFSGHKYAVNCVAFSPTGKYLVSVGSQHDNIVNVFDWKSNLKIASNKVSAKVVAVSFSEDGNYFVTVGNRHVKYWYLEGGRKYKEPIPLMGRSAILGELRNNDFCAVACGKGEMVESTYAITRNGHLVEFNSRRLLDKWVMCRTTSANCIVASAKLIFVGCADAIIRVFNVETLEYVTTLPRTHYLGVDVAQGVQISHMMSAPQNSKYPDTIAIVFDEARSRVSCVYNDHSLYIWDLRDIRRVGKSHSFLYHSACIWGVESVPSNFLRNGNVQCKLPSDSFITCSSDDTIRVWGLEDCETNEIYRKNIYSKELLKVIYIDPELNFIKDTDNPTQSNEKSSSYDGRNGVRCIKVSTEYGQMATGDRSGNIRIYNLNNLKLITSIEAHDSEVLCLEYTNEKIDRKLLASASRDRLIHVFDVENGYRILQTLDDHSSSITSVKFIGMGLQFQMISCGADKSIIFRNYQNNQFTRGNNCAGKNTLYDMEVDSTAKHILTACQDRNIRVYGTQNAKHTKTFKGSHSDEGTLIKLSLDLSGIYIATSCTDKTLSVYDYYSGECMAKMYGHSELVTGLKFTNDCKHLISASGDGCIFIWQVPHDMIVTMQARLSQQAMRSGQTTNIPRQIMNPFSDSPVLAEQQSFNEKFGSPPGHFLDEPSSSPSYKLSEVGQLPMWAKRKPDENASSPVLGTSPNQNQPQLNQKPRGKWAQRGQFDAETLDLRNIVDTPNQQQQQTIMISNNTPTSGYNSGGSKDVYNNYLSEDSSIDSGMENRRENPFMAPKVVMMEHNKMHSLNSESNTEHDGDVEDISDGERTSSDHGMIYYPNTHSSTPTDFKVNEMKEDELRKSMRRQKLEKQGLSVSQIIAVTAAGTGTGTSDDEDDASTPSGDNAERSLASTLGGSSESIPHPSTFLQVALDGPGSLSDHSKDKEKSRKSISAMHNIDNNKSTSISKSYTNSKKEELLKVINEAKQKLENEVTKSQDVRNTNKNRIKVGYKSSLRASQSISDLSHANADARTRLLRGAVGDTNTIINSNIVPIISTTSCQNQAPIPIYSYHHHKYHNFLNCAAPKAKIAQNCHLIHQIQNNYPPYPSHLGHYYYGQSSSANVSPQHRPTNLNVQIELPTVIPADKLKKHPGILKKYKSCPVSPVHEELDWAAVSDRANQMKISESHKNEASSSGYSGAIAKKRHTLYSDDAQTILNMIQSDTDRMIAEITQKYGDLDDYEPKSIHNEKEKERTSIIKQQQPDNLRNDDNDGKFTAKKEKHEHDFLSEEEEGNFSSDSLEDCSLDLDICDEKEKANYLKRKKKTVPCKKHHHKKFDTTDQPPKRSVSEYFIYEDYFTRIDINRKVSLSDILNDDSDKRHEEQKFLETQRHSSASFFLGHYPNRKSQESILSDDYSGGAQGEAISFCNSMESILSDESECKSAPLEILFEKGKMGQKNIGHIDSKSYGSSPNSTYFDYYMQHRFQDYESNPNEVKCDISNYGFDSLDGRSFKVLSSNSNARSPTHHYNQHPRAINTSFSVPQFTDDSLECFDDDFIPSLTSKVAQYNTNLNKSLCKDFANQRMKNPMHEKFNEPQQLPKPIIRSDVFADAAVSSVSSVFVMKKSCSFEIDMGNGQRKIIKNSKKFEQNLQRFEKERRDQQEQKMKLQKSDFNLEMDYVAHKPPVAHRRSSSMKGRGKAKIKEKFNTITCSQTTSSLATKAAAVVNSGFNTNSGFETRDFVNKDYLNKMKRMYKSNEDEKSFEVYIAEKGISEDDNMDSLDTFEARRKKKNDMENSIDSLDVLESSKNQNDDDEPSTSAIHNPIDMSFITMADLGKFRDIERKIDVINKLVELEERKLEQERVRRENRVKPLFDGNTKERGFVKHLTKNFDMLAKSTYDGNSQWYENTGMKRNYSLPDVLEGAKFQTFEFDDIDEPMKESSGFYDNNRSTSMKLYDFDDDFELSTADGDEGNKAAFVVDDDYEDENESSIRRACSLSDLSMGKGFKNPSTTSPKAAKERNVGRNLPKRSASSVGKSSTSGMGMRSVSVGMLNQASDSDQSEPIAATSRGGIMRPTISSNNKVNGGSNNGNGMKYINPRSAAGIISRRKGMQNSYSSVNLTTTGQDESSSEESPPPNNIASPIKPAVPPRPRNIQSQDQRRITNINTMLNSKKLELAAGMIDMPCKDSDLENADINTQFCSNVINQLMNTANAVLQLHQRLRSVDEPTSTGNNNLMLKELENAVIMTQSVLTKITARNADSSPENSTNGNTNNMNQDRLNNNHNLQSNGEYIQMMDKCSDLLNKVQIQKHVNNSSSN